MTLMCNVRRWFSTMKKLLSCFMRRNERMNSEIEDYFDDSLALFQQKKMVNYSKTIPMNMIYHFSIFFADINSVTKCYDNKNIGQVIGNGLLL